MHIAMFINGEHYAGAERVQDILVESLRENQRFSVSYVSVFNGAFKDRANLEGVNVFYLACSGLISQILSFRKIFKKNKFDLIHCHTPRTLLICGVISFVSGVRYVYHMHSPALHCGNSYLVNRINFLVEFFFARRAERVVCVSDAIRSHAEKYLGLTSNTSTVYNGVPALPHSKVKQFSGFSFRVAMVALFRPRKGLDDLLHAISLFNDRGFGKKLTLDLIGGFESKEYEIFIDELISRLGLVDYVNKVGFSNDPLLYAIEADYLVLPSKQGEGLPMVILEALSSGLPVITTEVEGNVEAIKNGFNGFVCAPKNSASIFQSLQHAYSDESIYESLSENCLHFFNSRFSSVVMCKRMEEIYVKPQV